MRLILIMCLTGWFIAVSGCAYLTSFNSNLPDKIEQLTQEGKYGKALDIISYVKPSNVDYSALMKQREKLLVLAEKLERKTIKQSRKYLAEKKWLKTEKILESALEKLPDSKPINTEYERFTKKRHRHLKNLEIALVQNNARWLIDNTSVKQAIEHILPNAEKKYSELKGFRKQINRISDKLVECVDYSVENKKWRQANDCLELADKLDPDAVSKEQHKEIQRHLVKLQLLNEQNINNKTKKLITEIKQGFSHENLMRAHKHLMVINRQEKKSREMRKLKQQLELKYRHRINEGINAGRELYSNGKITESLKVWNALMKVDPNNEKLQEHINRANRVLVKLERISNNKKKVAPP